jgi:hypothetical protein
VTPADIKERLASPERVNADAFRIAREICRLACRESDEDRAEGQELLLRALEHRAAFGPAVVLLDAALREVGLFPYLEPDELGLADRLAYECHRPDNLDDRVFHAPQARVYRHLIDGKSVVLSAPTSFGKSLIIDAVIASRQFKNIVIVVPTIALIDETRRRLSRFRSDYKIITHSFQQLGERNVYVMTQERVLEAKVLGHVDFFVIDEFYKLNPTASAADKERCALLNQAFYRLAKKCKHFYMLGPGIDGISPDFKSRLEFEFIHEVFQTVASDIHRVTAGDDELAALKKLCAKLDGPTIVFCSSPDRVAIVADAIRGCGSQPPREVDDAAKWIADNYHPDWNVVDALRNGIGIHHARIPRALAQYVVRTFNTGGLKFLVCTSTLIEGVNTKAKNIVIFDHKINRTRFDLFTFNNIRGRSGRMFEHFVGHVYVFHKPPQGDLPLVDVPAFTQSEGASDALLLQLEPEDLLPQSKERLSRFESQTLLSIDTLRQNTGVDPAKQLSLAQTLLDDPAMYARAMAWSGTPSWEQLQLVCELIWNHFDGAKLAPQSVRAHVQLAAMLSRLSQRDSMRDMIRAQLQYNNNDANQAVRSTLDFLRLWATFHFPRLLRALNAITRDIFSRHHLPVGNYAAYATLVENLFLDSALIALEEYGVPLPLARRLHRAFGNERDFDKLLERLRAIDVKRLGLAGFELDVLLDAQKFA